MSAMYSGNPSQHLVHVDPVKQCFPRQVCFRSSKFEFLYASVTNFAYFSMEVLVSLYMTVLESSLNGANV